MRMQNMTNRKWQFSRNVGWIPRTLRLPSLFAFAFVDIALVACLLTLSVCSSSNDGFVTIQSQNITSFGISWNLGLLWTALPVLIFRLLGIYWESIANPIAQRQPYVDLLKDGGAPAKKSVLLDYLSIPILWRWWTALRNNHLLVSACTILTLVMSIIVSALSARLFALQVVLVAAETPILFNTTFNESTLNATTDWIPILDTVSAIWVHHGGLLPWTDHQYAFQPYHLQGFTNAEAEVTANTKAYSAYLNCSVISDPQIKLESSHLYLTANDRGCDIDQDFLVSDMQEVYFKTSSEISCSAAAWYSRLVFTAATYSSESPNHVSDVTLLSCITSYRVTSGSLVTVTRNDSSSLSMIQEFHPSVFDDGRPTLWRLFEQGIMSPTALNPKTIWSTSAFGSLVLYYAQELAGDRYLSSDVLERAVTEIFSAVYLTAAAQHAFVPLEPSILSTGQAITLTQRLFTVNWVAYTITIILLLSLFADLVAIGHVYTNATFLEEEPAGLLAHAAILEKSPLIDVAAKVRAQGSRSVVETAARGDLKDSRWGGTAKEERDGWVLARFR